MTYIGYIKKNDTDTYITYRGDSANSMTRINFSNILTTYEFDK